MLVEEKLKLFQLQTTRSPSTGKVNCNQSQMIIKESRRNRKRESCTAKLSWRSPPLRFPAATKRWLQRLRQGDNTVPRKVGPPRGAKAGLCLLSLYFRFTFLELPVVCDSRIDSVMDLGTTSCQDACWREGFGPEDKTTQSSKRHLHKKSEKIGARIDRFSEKRGHAAQSPLLADSCKHLASSAASTVHNSWRRTTGLRSN